MIVLFLTLPAVVGIDPVFNKRSISAWCIGQTIKTHTQLSLALFHAYSFSLSLTYTQTQKHTRKHTHTYIHAYSNTQNLSHTQTDMLALSLSFSFIHRNPLADMRIHVGASLLTEHINNNTAGLPLSPKHNYIIHHASLLRWHTSKHGWGVSPGLLVHQHYHR